jgi:hypothetical protein
MLPKLIHQINIELYIKWLKISVITSVIQVQTPIYSMVASGLHDRGKHDYEVWFVPQLHTAKT